MSPAEVDQKVGLLSKLCGEDDEKDVAKSIRFADCEYMKTVVI